MSQNDYDDIFADSDSDLDFLDLLLGGDFGADDLGPLPQGYDYELSDDDLDFQIMEENDGKIVHRFRIQKCQDGTEKHWWLTINGPMVPDGDCTIPVTRADVDALAAALDRIEANTTDTDEVIESDVLDNVDMEAERGSTY